MQNINDRRQCKEEKEWKWIKRFLSSETEETKN